MFTGNNNYFTKILVELKKKSEILVYPWQPRRPSNDPPGSGSSFSTLDLY